MLLLAALSPIFLLVLALLVIRKPLIQAAPAVYIWTILIAFFFWRLTPDIMLAAALKGLFISFEVIVIVLGAVWFVTFLKKTKVIKAIEAQLSEFSPDRRLQAIVITWIFGGFIEGSAGFGTPAAIVAPLMVAIGFPALLTVTLALVANSTSVTFGAVGTPILIGMAGLQTEGVGVTAASINLLAGIFVPVMLLALVVRSRSDNRMSSFLECLPWTIWAGAAFTVPYAVLAHFGNEFPSLIGGAVGLILISVTIRAGFLIPRRCWRFESDEGLKSSLSEQKGVAAAVYPYLLMLAILFAGRYLFASLTFEFSLPGDVSHFMRAFNPGFAFITSLLLLSFINASSRSYLLPSFVVALKTLVTPLVSIFFISALVQTMLLSSSNPAAQAGMLETIAVSFKTPYLIWLSATIGAFGAFLAGSATVSNLLFGPLQQQIAFELGLSTTSILALQLVGAGIGNMVAIPNILAVQATAGLKEKEGLILLKTIGPCIAYLLIATVLGNLLFGST
jgi:lactate permease